MKRISVFFILVSILLFPVCLFAQTAKIIDVQGDVLVKNKADLKWEKARINMLLGKEAELKTGKKSECILAFDEELKNILSIKENSHIKIENVIPAKVLLPKGRVFSIIENIAKIKSFQIRTPTATAGARATGWLSESNGGGSSFKCFDDTIHIEGLDEEGNVTGELDLSDGFGIDVGRGGVLGELFELSARDFDEWSEIRENIEDIRGEIEEEREVEEERVLEEPVREEIREESREDYRDTSLENRRIEEEERRKVEEEKRITSPQ